MTTIFSSRKLLTSASCALALMSSPLALADTVLGVYVGGQSWRTDTSGSFADGQQRQSFQFEDDQQQSLYAALEHPIPLFPNVKVRQNQLEATGQVTLGQDFSFAGQSFAAGSQITSATDLSHTDFTFYYEILDNDLTAFDLGVTAKRVDAQFTVNHAGSVATRGADGWVPTLYAHARFGIPATDWTVYALGNAISIDDNSIRDIEAGFEYRLVENLAVDINLQLGYRSVRIELDDLDNMFADLEFKGPYLGLEIHF